MHQKHSPRADFYRHLSFAAVGGFFGGYAILARCGVLASAQTMNLLEMVMDALHGKGGSALLHLLCLVIYFAGTMSTVLLPHLFHVDMRRLCPAVDALVAVAVGFFPENMPVIAALYPIFFAMSVQWSTFAGARGFNSSTIFSTNNTKQTALALAHFLCEGERAYLGKAGFYAATLLCFHLGATASFFAVKAFGYFGSWCALPLIAGAYIAVVREEAAERALSPARIREQEVEGETAQEMQELARQGREYLPRRVAYWAARMDVMPTGLHITAARTRSRASRTAASGRTPFLCRYCRFICRRNSSTAAARAAAA